MQQSYSSEEGAAAYAEAREGVEASILVDVLTSLLPGGSSLLELGMGPGNELVRLARRFDVTGSDKSKGFLELFSRSHPSFKLLHLDAVTIETDRRFDCVFSNKVLHHLSREDLGASFDRQRRVVKPGGLLFHSFWLGKGTGYSDGLHFTKYTEDVLLEMASGVGKTLLSFTYSELNADDSIAIAVSPFKA